MTVSTLTTDEALRHCRVITRRRARNFYYGLKLSPEPQRSALYAVYAWMRHADDIVDDGAEPEAARARFDEFRAATEAALHGSGPTDDPLWVGLADTVRRFGLDERCFHEMIDGQLEDLESRRYETFDDLRRYCYRVASTVGLVCLEVWGYDDAAATALAVDRGIAFQLTNMLRDFAEDLDDGRVYLPKEDFDRFGIDPDTLRAWSRPEACDAFYAFQVERAEDFFRRSEGLEDLITPRCVPTLWTMTEIYHGLLAKIRNDPARTAGGTRVRLSAVRKGAIVIRARWHAGRRGARSG